MYPQPYIPELWVHIINIIVSFREFSVHIYILYFYFDFILGDCIGFIGNCRVCFVYKIDVGDPVYYENTITLLRSHINVKVTLK